jgi:hypothetical protein
MGRTKQPRVSAPPAGLSEEKLREAALLLNLPVANLQSLLSGGAASNLSLPSEGQQQSALQVEPEEVDIDDILEEVPASPSPRSEHSDDVAEWQTRGAEFSEIDGDIDVYPNFNYWVEDPSAVGQPGVQGGLARAPATGFVEPENHMSVPPTWPQQPTQQFGTPQPAAPPPTPQDPAINLSQAISWEILGATMVDQQPLQQSRETSGWTMIEARPSGQRQLQQQGTETRKGDDLQIISVDPLQRQTQARQQRRRGAYEDRGRQEDAGKTRELKACLRCRQQKIRCIIDKGNPKGVCVTCQEMSGPKVHYLPCLRYRLTESSLFRTGKPRGLEFTFRWPVMKLKDIDVWASPEVRTILVESDFYPTPLQLSVRRFVPIPGKDSLHRSWMDHKKGVKKTKETTPYAIVDMHKAKMDMRTYVADNTFPFMDYFMKKPGVDKLSRETYEFARKHMQRTEVSIV